MDYDNIFLVTTFFNGKTLDEYKNEIISEKELKFISACIIQSLVYFRKENIIHRDLHLKNVIMDSDNYFNIIDFSSSINYSDKDKKEFFIKTYSNVLSPEILDNNNYSFNSDYYSFGSMIYYLIFKRYPNVIKIEKNMKQISIDYGKTKNYSEKCIDFINKLIISEPKERIGYKDINEMKNHPWLNNFDWYKLENKQIESPFNFTDNSSNKYFSCSKIKISENHIERYKNISKTYIYKKLINKFEFP